MRWLDRTTDALAGLAAWLLVATGAMLTFEVSARYLFNAPTIWAAELSELCLIWASFAALAALLRRRQHVSVNILTSLLAARGQRVAESFSLVVVLVLCAVVVWHGGGIALDSFERGRSTGTMLNIPNWWAEAAVPLGFALLAAQAVAELVRLWRGERPPTEQSAKESS